MEDIVQKIYKSGLKLLEPLTSDEVYQTIVHEAIRLVGADYGSLTLEQNREFKSIYSTLPISVKRRKKGYTYQSFKTGQVIVIYPQDNKEFKRVHPEIVSLGLESIINIPLSYRRKAIGVLVLNSREKELFTKKELDTLKLFGSIASLAIRKTQSYDETRHALDARDQFFSMAAHELRTPLTAINGYAQLLQTRLSGSSSPESRWIEQLSWECLRLTNLVKEIMLTNQIRSGKIQYSLKECKLVPILEKAINTFKFTYSDREFLFKNELGKDSGLIIGDSDKILQLLISLLENSVKFTPSESRISIILSETKKKFNLKIRDQGIGISEKELNKVFEGFYKGTNHSREGMGLGLFLARDIIKNHHGSIKANSKQNKGTTFSINLPKIKI